MNLRFQIFAIVLFLMFAVGSFITLGKDESVGKSTTEPVKEVKEAVASIHLPTPTLSPIPNEYTIPRGTFVGQTFNNCGPASLSIALSYQGKNVSQGELASKLRPFNNPLGGVDDKAVFAHELVKEAQHQGFESLERPNGTISQLQLLMAHDVSIIVRTWLNPGEDIGHYRVMKGYNKTTGELYVDDPYNGPNMTISEDEFLELWQPFNYGYILVYPQEKQQIVSHIIGEDMDAQSAFERSVTIADEELKENPADAYAMFNKAVALYYLGKPDETIRLYEKASAMLPRRMLWYQPEPIYAYEKTGDFETALSHIDSILSSGNLAYSELHLLKGKIFEAQGDIDSARRSYQAAIEYNRNDRKAQEALRNVS